MMAAMGRWCVVRMSGRRGALALALVCALGASGCGKDEAGASAQDTNGADTHGADTAGVDATADVTAPDGGELDGAQADAGGGDSGVTDAAGGDSVVSDATSADSIGADSAVGDSAGADASASDGGGSDAGEAAPAPFPFQTEPGATNDALGTVFDLGFKDAETPEEAAAMKAERDAALVLIAKDLPGARAALIAALATIAPDDYMSMAALAPVLREVGPWQAAIDDLLDVVMTEPAGDVDKHEVPGDEMTRQIAIRVLLHYARAGDSASRAALLKAVAAPDDYTAMSAIRYTYLLSTNRREAQRSMRALMDKSRVWLLYKY